MACMTTKRLPPPVWVAAPAALRDMAAELIRQPRVAVDTESNSLYAYREQVCLIQFSTPEQDYLLDPLALTDLSLLAPLFADPNIEKVFHAAEYDLLCLKRDFGFKFANLFDTMVAARILGYQAVGLGKLLAQKFGVVVNKRFQKANWGRRPLPADMLNYARFDTHYLLALRDILKAELETRDLWPLAQEDFVLATHVNGRTPRTHCPAWERMGGGRKLNGRQLTVLNELCLAREKLAERLDRPVFKVVSNKILLTLSETMPRTPRDLEIGDLTSRQIERFGEALLAAVRRGMRAPLVKWTPSSRPDDAFLMRLDVLRNWRKHTAQAMGVESDIVLPRRFMNTIAERNPRDIRTLREILAGSPWRLIHFGKDIIATLDKVQS